MFGATAIFVGTPKEPVGIVKESKDGGGFGPLAAVLGDISAFCANYNVRLLGPCSRSFLGEPIRRKPTLSETILKIYCHVSLHWSHFSQRVRVTWRNRGAGMN